jgi:hypothetical protein
MTPRTANLIVVAVPGRRELARLIADRSVPAPALRRLVTTIVRREAAPGVTATRGAVTAAATVRASARPGAGVREAGTVLTPGGMAAMAAHAATQAEAPPTRTIRDTKLPPISNSQHRNRRRAVGRRIIISLLP